ncbi:Rap1a/Tai family immunity protein [Endozoicomonas ascidiicola]|uniref:Rap1a/Tai family immunity protein n=1 Tax=Endozoicomonas ascidiicola TaxID=1698521 RepID=UPI0008313EE3|nr:Rap1a/Tai family immunity protein [Endozoicomonas ascidiicola]
MNNNKCVRGLILVLFTLCIPTLTRANGNNDGNELLKMCTEAQYAIETRDFRSPEQVFMCLGFIQGVQSSLELVVAAQEMGGEIKDSMFKLCWPDGITLGQNVRVVTKYLKDNPKDLHRYKTYLALQAFIEAYQCTG